MRQQGQELPAGEAGGRAYLMVLCWYLIPAKGRWCSGKSALCPYSPVQWTLQPVAAQERASHRRAQGTETELPSAPWQVLRMEASPKREVETNGVRRVGRWGRWS